MVMADISSGVKKAGWAISTFSAASSSFILFKPDKTTSLSAGTSGLFSCVVQDSAITVAVNPPMINVFIDFRLSMIVILNVLLFHFFYNILTGSHGKCQNGPGNIFICLGNKGPAIYTKKIFAVMRLAVFI